MSDIVRVQIQDGEWRTIAQLDKHLAEHYIENLLSDRFSDVQTQAFYNSKSPLKQEELTKWAEVIDNAQFDVSRIRTIPAWVEGELQ